MRNRPSFLLVDKISSTITIQENLCDPRGVQRPLIVNRHVYIVAPLRRAELRRDGHGIGGIAWKTLKATGIKDADMLSIRY